MGIQADVCTGLWRVRKDQVIGPEPLSGTAHYRHQHLGLGGDLFVLVVPKDMCLAEHVRLEKHLARPSRRRKLVECLADIVLQRASSRRLIT